MCAYSDGDAGDKRKRRAVWLDGASLCVAARGGLAAVRWDVLVFVEHGLRTRNSEPEPRTANLLPNPSPNLPPSRDPVKTTSNSPDFPVYRRNHVKHTSKIRTRPHFSLIWRKSPKLHVGNAGSAPVLRENCRYSCTKCRFISLAAASTQVFREYSPVSKS